MSTGSAFASSAGIRKEKVRIDQGVEMLTTYRRNHDTVSHFCKVCGSVLFLIVRAEQYAHVQMGTLVDDPQIRPMAHFHVASKAAWHTITDAMPQFAEFPPRRPA